ncbi:MAG: C39 family peptidase [Cyanobacteriota bacterium]
MNLNFLLPNHQCLTNKTNNIHSKNVIFKSSLKIKKPLNKDVISFKGVCNNEQKPYTDKMFQIPDFKQQNPAFPDNGSYYCGPASVSNSLFYLKENGYPDITNNKSQVELVKELATYFKTNPDSGSTVNDFCNGLNNFIKDKGYTVKKLEYQGYRPIDKFKNSNIPKLDDIKQAIEKNCVVFLLFGFYQKPVINNGKVVYKRDDGHWTTLVGHSFDGSNFNSNYLVVHDPFHSNIKAIENRYIELQQLHNGILKPNINDKESTLQQNAAGYYKINKGIDYLDKNQLVSILDGVVILELEKPQS